MWEIGSEMILKSCLYS